jgi:PAS domain S-box-containing protein
MNTIKTVSRPAESAEQNPFGVETVLAQRTAELIRERDQLQTLLNGATNVSIIALDAKGLITAFNSGAERILGYTAEEMVGKQTPFIFHLEPEVIARGLELAAESGKPVAGVDVFSEKVRNGPPEERDWTYVRKDGSHVTVNLVITGLRDASGGAVGFLYAAMDVTARRSAESALRASEERFRLMIDAVEDYALLMLDAGGRIVSWNTGAERMKGYTASEIIGKHFSCFYLPEDIEKGHSRRRVADCGPKGPLFGRRLTGAQKWLAVFGRCPDYGDLRRKRQVTRLRESYTRYYPTQDNGKHAA